MKREIRKTVRFAASEYERVARSAAKYQLAISEYLRDAALARADGRHVAADLDVSDIADRIAEQLSSSLHVDLSPIQAELGAIRRLLVQGSSDDDRIVSHIYRVLFVERLDEIRACGTVQELSHHFDHNYWIQYIYDVLKLAKDKVRVLADDTLVWSDV